MKQVHKKIFNIIKIFAWNQFLHLRKKIIASKYQTPWLELFQNLDRNYLKKIFFPNTIKIILRMNVTSSFQKNLLINRKKKIIIVFLHINHLWGKYQWFQKMLNINKTLMTTMFLLKLKSLKIQNYHQLTWFTQWKKIPNQTRVFLGFKGIFQMFIKIMHILALILEEMAWFHFQIMKKIKQNIIIWMKPNPFSRMKTQNSLLVRPINWVKL